MHIMHGPAALLLLTILALPLLATSSPALSRQVTCPNKCKGKKGATRACKTLGASCKVKKCKKPNGSKGFACKPKKRQTAEATPSPSPLDGGVPTPAVMPSTSPSLSIPTVTPSASLSPPQSPSASPSPSVSLIVFEPQFKAALLCRSGKSIVNIGIVNVRDELHIPMFAKTDEKAMEWLDCIKNDRSSRSVEEYLRFTDDNCIGEDPKMCNVTDLAAGLCECKKGQPDRCINVPYAKSVRRCNDEP